MPDVDVDLAQSVIDANHPIRSILRLLKPRPVARYRRDRLVRRSRTARPGCCRCSPRTSSTSSCRTSRSADCGSTRSCSRSCCCRTSRCTSCGSACPAGSSAATASRSGPRSPAICSNSRSDSTTGSAAASCRRRSSATWRTSSRCCSRSPRPARRPIFTLLGALILTAIRVPQFVPLFILVVPATALLISAMRKRSAARNEAFRHRVEQLNAHVNEMAHLMPITRAHGLEGAAVRRMRGSVEEVGNAGFALDMVNGRLGAFSWVTYQMLGAVCLVGAAFVAYTGFFPVTARRRGPALQLLRAADARPRRCCSASRRSSRRAWNRSARSARCMQEPDIERNEGKLAVTSVRGRDRDQVGLLRLPGRRAARGGGHQPGGTPGRDDRVRRAVRRRQVDDAEHAARLPAPDVAGRSCSTASTRRSWTCVRTGGSSRWCRRSRCCSTARCSKTSRTA